MKTQYTQGPWEIDIWDFIDNGKINRKELIIQNSKNKLATINCDFPELNPRKTENPWEIPHSEGMANARLIAAAPELLDMLYLALPFVEEADEFNKPTHNLGPKIRALLKKIEGES